VLPNVGERTDRARTVFGVNGRLLSTTLAAPPLTPARHLASLAANSCATFSASGVSKRSCDIETSSSRSIVMTPGTARHRRTVRVEYLRAQAAPEKKDPNSEW
jgi:hypothetical protein